jgi:hydrogenase maturation protease
MARPLLIGIGNRLRGDDGAGQLLIEHLAGGGCGRLRTLAVQQLTPELAAEIAEASAVLFVDACPGRRRLALEAIAADGGGGGSFSHQLSPARLLALSDALYGARPPAWQLLIPAEQLDPGAGLSAATVTAMATALRLLRRWRARHA